MTVDFTDDPRRGCAPGKVDPDIFFADRGGQMDKARAACAGCPFRTACVQRALKQGERFGIYGGVLMSSDMERGAAERGERTTSDRVHELWQQGNNDGQIGRTLGIDPSTVRGHRLRLALPAHATGRGKGLKRVDA